MDFSTALRTCFGKYATFGGRAMRSEFWFFFLFSFVLNVLLNLIDSSGIVAGLFGLAIFLPSLAVGARRLHDTDRTGWWQLLFLIPLVGLVILIIFFAERGTAGTNRYGDDPTAGLVP